jgi:DNA-binding transcriptional regulator YiaG
MLIPKITGTMIRAGRVFAHLSQDQLAARAGIHRDCLRKFVRRRAGGAIRDAV